MNLSGRNLKHKSTIDKTMFKGRFKSKSDISLPVSNSTVDVQIINTTTNVVCPTDFFLEPNIKGQEYLNLPTFAFLVENKKQGIVALFDLGCRKDWWNLSPVVQDSIQKGIAGIEVSKDIKDILVGEGFDLGRVNTVILRYL